MRVACYKAQEQVFHGFLHAFGQSTDHAKIDEFDDWANVRWSWFDENISWMWVGMEEASLKELVEVRIDGTFRHLHAINTGGIQRCIVIDFDPINPFQHQHMARYILFMYAGNVDSGIILEHVFESLSIRGL